jgi:hypothetical protein
VDRRRLSGVVPQHAEDAQARPFGPADRRTHIERIEGAELVEMPLDEIRQLQQDLLALIRFEFAPGAFERFPGCCHRTIDILRVPFRHGRQQFTCRRITTFEALAGCGIEPFAADQHLLERAVSIGVARRRNRFCLGHDSILRERDRRTRYIRMNIALGIRRHNRRPGEQSRWGRGSIDQPDPPIGLDDRRRVLCRGNAIPRRPSTRAG